MNAHQSADVKAAIHRAEDAASVFSHRNGSCTFDYVRACIRDACDAAARAALEGLTLSDPPNAPALLTPATFCGMRLIADERVPEGIVQIRSDDGALWATLDMKRGSYTIHARPVPSATEDPNHG